MSPCRSLLIGGRPGCRARLFHIQYPRHAVRCQRMTVSGCSITRVERQPGQYRVTVERPLRMNFAATEERIARIEDERAFQNLAKSKKRAGPAHDAEVAEGEARQEAIRGLLRPLAEQATGEVVRDREAFVEVLRGAEAAASVKLSAAERKAVLSALSERDAGAEVCRDRHGKPEPDTELRDTETVPLGEDVDAYIASEVLPHVPDAWVDERKTKIGYELPLNRHFYVYEPPRPLDKIEADLQALEHEITDLLTDVVRS